MKSQFPLCSLGSVRALGLGALLVLSALGLRAETVPSVTVERVGDTVTVAWVMQNDPKYQEVMRDTDANPAGRKRAGVVHGNVRSFSETVPDTKAEYWYWIKVVSTDGKTSNLGPFKAAKKK